MISKIEKVLFHKIAKEDVIKLVESVSFVISKVSTSLLLSDIEKDGEKDGEIEWPFD